MGLWINANALEVFCAWGGVLAGTLFALRDLPELLVRVDDDEAGLAAAVFGISAILDSVEGAREGSRV